MGLPVEVNNLMLGSLGGYTVGRSLRFRSSASAYLQRTNATTGTDPLKFTVSGWMKRGLSSASYFSLVGSDTGSNAFNFIGFSGDNFAFRIRNSSSVDLVQLVSTAVFRDFSAWYHFVAVYDSANATSTERVKLYVNGVQITAFATATYPSLNQAPTGDFLTDMQIGRTNTNNVNQNYGDGYLAEVNFIDGQALTPSSFGETDSITGVWNPKKYSGTYGTNGFYLPFSDNSALTTASNVGLGKDFSGNGNYWVTNNISITAGTTYDSIIDSPTVSASSSNYAVLNPLSSHSSFQPTSGNLNYSASGAISQCRVSPTTIAISSGKWYWEVNTTTVGGGNYNTMIGIRDATVTTTTDSQNRISGYAYATNGEKITSLTNTAYGSAMADGDVIGVAFDSDAGTITFYKNNTSQGTAFTGISGLYYPVIAFNTGTTSFSISGAINFGQRPFSYTPPSGYKALNTYNLPAPSIANGAQYMAATTYTGNNSTNTINNGNNTTNATTFQPNMVWIKSRSSVTNHMLDDSVRGVGKDLFPNLTSAESTTGLITSFNSNGFTLGPDGGGAGNGNALTYVAWQWKGGGTAVTNNSGTISSQVSANTSAGFSIITYTETSGSYTVGHGLGVTPSMIILKERNAVGNWIAWHNYWTAPTKNGLYLNATNAAFTTGANWLNSTSSTTFGITAGQVTGGSANIVAYCFAAVRGYSAFGSYTGNGSSDGPFIYTGFRPRFILWKNASLGVADWEMIDTSRDTYNVAGLEIYPNSSAAEVNLSPRMDILSNGFKIRTAGSGPNASGNTMIYAAFAENPFNYSRAR